MASPSVAGPLPWGKDGQVFLFPTLLASYLKEESHVFSSGLGYIGVTHPDSPEQRVLTRCPVWCPHSRCGQFREGGTGRPGRPGFESWLHL